MAVDFSFTNIVNIVAQELFNGNTTIGGLVIMLAISFFTMAFLANIKAPIQYSLAPMVVLSIIFGAMGIMDMTASFLIIILCAVIIAIGARRTVGD